MINILARVGKTYMNKNKNTNTEINTNTVVSLADISVRVGEIIIAVPVLQSVE